MGVCLNISMIGDKMVQVVCCYELQVGSPDEVGTVASWEYYCAEIEEAYWRRQSTRREWQQEFPQADGSVIVRKYGRMSLMETEFGAMSFSGLGFIPGIERLPTFFYCRDSNHVEDKEAAEKWREYFERALLALKRWREDA